MALAQRMTFYQDGFRYMGKDYLFRDVHHIDWWQAEDRQSGSDGKPIPSYRSKLSVSMASGKVVHIQTATQWSRTNSTILKDVHTVITEAAEKLLARSFDARMDAYEAELASKGYLIWGSYQITPDGNLFYRHSLCLNLNDATVRCLLYPFRLVAVRSHKHWWGRLLLRLVRNAEDIDLVRDRDCFLFLLRRHIGLYWPKEVLRTHHGQTADGKPQPQPEAPKTASPGPIPPPHQQAHTPPPPPPPPKPRLGVEHYLGVLEIRHTAAWPEVKSAYRTMAKRYHPDLMRGRGAPENALKQAEDTLKTVNEAFAWLEDYYRMRPKT